jgi:hypothetical protein
MRPNPAELHHLSTFSRRAGTDFNMLQRGTCVAARLGACRGRSAESAEAVSRRISVGVYPINIEILRCGSVLWHSPCKQAMHPTPAHHTDDRLHRT